MIPGIEREGEERGPPRKINKDSTWERPRKEDKHTFYVGGEAKLTESMASKAKLTNEEVLTLLGLQVGDKLDEREQAIADRALSKIRAAMLPDTKDK